MTPASIVMLEASIERLQILAVVLAKSVMLARNELDISAAFAAVEPLAQRVRRRPRRSPWHQRELIARISDAMLAAHQLVDRAEMLEKPEPSSPGV